jgi:hypothetical protein
MLQLQTLTISVTKRTPMSRSVLLLTSQLALNGQQPTAAD